MALTVTGYALSVVFNKGILNKAIGVAEVSVAVVVTLGATTITPEAATTAVTAEVVVEEAEAASPVLLMGDDQSPLILTFHPLNGML
jgi:hypothetical protein